MESRAKRSKLRSHVAPTVKLISSIVDFSFYRFPSTPIDRDTPVSLEEIPPFRLGEHYRTLMRPCSLTLTKPANWCLQMNPFAVLAAKGFQGNKPSRPRATRIKIATRPDYRGLKSQRDRITARHGAARRGEASESGGEAHFSRWPDVPFAVSQRKSSVASFRSSPLLLAAEK